MKSPILKSVLVLAAGAAYLATSIAYAEVDGRYLRVKDVNFHDYYSSYHSIIADVHRNKVNALNDSAYFNGALKTSPYYWDDLHYIVLPGTQKRYGVFKLQKSTNGKEDGPRASLVMDTKEEAQDFCNYLAKTGGEFIEGNVVGKYAFASNWLGSVKEVIALEYKVDYQGDLTPKPKHVFCPNQWGGLYNDYWNNPDPAYPDENEINGVKASGLVGGTYKVVCMNSNVKPDATFTSTDDWKGRRDTGVMHTYWTNGSVTFDTLSKPQNRTLEFLDQAVGVPYCKG